MKNQITISYDIILKICLFEVDLNGIMNMIGVVINKDSIQMVK